MVAENPQDASSSASGLFNSALEAFVRGELDEAVTRLRSGFFENLYIAPSLIGEAFHPQEIWYPTPSAEPDAATEYASRYGRPWRDAADALGFLRKVWHDPVVRRELKSFINLSKAILQAPGPSAQAEYIQERRWFVDERRIRGTQTEILGRLERVTFRRPIGRPRVDSLHLAATDPARTVEFFRSLLEVDPVRTSRRARGYAEFDLPGARLVIHGHDRLAAGDPYRLGPRPHSLGWGLVLLLRVREFDRYLGNAVRAGIDVLDRDLETRGERFFLVRDPSGYLIEIAE